MVRWLRFLPLAPALGAAAPAWAGPLQDLIDAAAAGSTVLVPAGVYRERVTVGKPLTLVGADGAAIHGSDLWTAWTQSGGVWISQGTVPPMSTGGLFYFPRAQWPEQVFLDGQPLLQVDSAAAPGPGEFKIMNRASDRRVALGQNPAGRTVEVTVRARWFTVQADDVTLRNIDMRHCGNPSQTGCFETDRNRTIVEDAEMAHAHGAVVSLGGGDGHRLRRLDIHHGGNLGVHGTNHSNASIEFCEIHDNNTEGFNAAWESGGVKMTDSTGDKWLNNHVHDNWGPGLWSDIRHDNVEIAFNRVHHNDMGKGSPGEGAAPGIMFEISVGAKIHHNVVWENGWGQDVWGWGPGILVSGSRDVEVYENVAAWNGDGITVVSQDRGDRPGVYGGLSIHDNVILQESVGTALGWFQDWDGPLYNSGNSGERNAYWLDRAEPTGGRFEWDGGLSTLSAFNATPGGRNGRYLTDAEKNQIIVQHNLPDRRGGSLPAAPASPRGLRRRGEKRGVILVSSRRRGRRPSPEAGQNK